jgi:uncharacterized alkaline shock family protein YloU
VSVVAQTEPGPPSPSSLPAGRTDGGTISIADRVVMKIAAQAALENPDAGAAAARMLGRAVPAAGRLGVRGTDLDALPKTSVEVDGTKAVVNLEISVRWPACVPEVTRQIRALVRDRVRGFTGLEVDEVRIIVADLAAGITPPLRVR